MSLLSKFDGERKSRQFTAAFKPSVFETFQKIAYIRRMSPNNLLGEIMEQYTTKNADLVAQYNEIKEKE